MRTFVRSRFGSSSCSPAEDVLLAAATGCKDRLSLFSAIASQCCISCKQECIALAHESHDNFSSRIKITRVFFKLVLRLKFMRITMRKIYDLSTLLNTSSQFFIACLRCFTKDWVFIYALLKDWCFTKDMNFWSTRFFLSTLIGFCWPTGHFTLE